MAGGGETKTISKIVNSTTTLPAGQVVTLDAIALNLADGSVLKVGIGLRGRRGRRDKIHRSVNPELSPSNP